jgi:transketolase
MGEILGALDRFPAAEGPMAIIANTVKGKNVPAVEGKTRAHFTSLSDDELKEALERLEVA